MSPVSDDLPSNVEDEESEGEEGEEEEEGEAINETERETKIKMLERLLTTHYDASKCVVLCLVCCNKHSTLGGSASTTGPCTE